MSEQITLTAPIVIPQKTTSNYKVARLLLDMENASFIIVARGNQGEIVEAFRKGTEATDLMKILNKANGTVKSLEKRALEWLQSQPEGSALIGTITGTPD